MPVATPSRLYGVGLVDMSHTRQDATNHQTLLKRSSPSSVVERNDADRRRHLSDGVATQSLFFPMCHKITFCRFQG